MKHSAMSDEFEADFRLALYCGDMRCAAPAAQRICGISLERDRAVIRLIKTLGREIYPERTDGFGFSEVLYGLQESSYLPKAELRRLELWLANLYDFDDEKD